MSLDELFALLLFLYTVGAVATGLLRRQGRRSGTGSEEDNGLDPVPDMDELERRLRRAWQEALGAPGSPGGGEDAMPAEFPEPRQLPEPAAESLPGGAAEPVATHWPTDDGAWWSADGGEDRGLEWEDPVLAGSPGGLPPEAATARSATSEPAGRPVPEALAAFVAERGLWPAAVVLKEILDPPRALRPYRWPPRV
ncbi:MAG: hypothetical protein H0Z37_04485 [Firmicutes bacterium]|nr:hypothetical protein [Bacillota bacterium]